jgi:hypothetical protein
LPPPTFPARDPHSQSPPLHLTTWAISTGMTMPQFMYVRASVVPRCRAKQCAAVRECCEQTEILGAMCQGEGSDQTTASVRAGLSDRELAFVPHENGVLRRARRPGTPPRRGTALRIHSASLSSFSPFQGLPTGAPHAHPLTAAVKGSTWTLTNPVRQPRKRKSSSHSTSCATLRGTSKSIRSIWLAEGAQMHHSPINVASRARAACNCLAKPKKY